ncbi:ABC transporter ATP-binding protein [Arsenicitalea aurantiaca]|uniref:ABC transporter ATP-binding protein n=1 Tax=Arsenicitalea aurantiaca TaxID=1783274 RepID=A0A433XA16_9HYPH|nr:ABC transporter ATP-binding protein [Arsenicitalea aurantiaca]RUT30957.1 ABC transporter ATP-binding protein [Arsenicitalea aurantiaca]
MLTIKDLSRRFGAAAALDVFSLSVPEGEVACLVGPSGCGKSTLLRLVAGLDRPDAGSIAIGGETISEPGWALEPHKRRLNMVFQDYALWPHMRVRNIIGYGLNRLPAPERMEKVDRLLELMQIADLADRLPSQISGGQQQRVAIARALATDPDVLLFDEPLSSLDVQLRLEMRREFGSLFKALGKTVLYVTHDPLEACAFADTLVVMSAGRIEQMGRPEALFAAPRSAWIATLAGYDTRLDGTVVSRAEHEIRVRLGDQALSVRPPTAPVSEGDSIRLMVNPGRLRLVDADGHQDNALCGTVMQELFEGNGWRVAIDLGGQHLSVMHPSRIGLGQRARVLVSESSVIAFEADARV